MATGSKRESSKPDALELAATAISAILLAALIAFLAWDAFQPSGAAAFEVNIERSTQRSGQLYVTVAVRNVGDEAARMVEVKVTTASSETEGHFTIDWLPGRSTRRGVAILPPDAVNTPIKAEVAGYAFP